jgi:DivIVA domain-containing protein
MNADPSSIDRIRNTSFESARRGYKKQDVDRFLASLADWLASGEGREQTVVVKEALEDVGRRTGAILVTAEASAQEIREKAQKAREDADAYAKQKREQADQQAQALKESSEAEAERTRSVAARDAEETITKSKAEIRTLVAQGEEKKGAIEAEIEELGQRRDSIVKRIDELALQLSGAANEHRPAGKPKTEETPKPEASGKEGNGDGAAGSGQPKAKVSTAPKRS